MPFHFNFFHRWRPLSEDHFGAFDVPLIQNGRAVDTALEGIEGPRASLAPLEQLLRSVWKSTSEWTFNVASMAWGARNLISIQAPLRARRRRRGHRRRALVEPQRRRRRGRGHGARDARAPRGLGAARRRGAGLRRGALLVIGGEEAGWWRGEAKFIE